MAELKPMSPDIALFHILPRLPAKSVSRFKCVSKEWHFFITTPWFPKMHLLHQNHEKLLFLPNNRPWDFFTIDCETPEDGCTAFRPLPFKVGHGQRLSVATSLHGMVCLLVTKPRNCVEYSDIILWNPVTCDHKALSKVGSHEYCYDACKVRYALFYRSSEDDYNLVGVTHDRYLNINNVYIYSLKSDSWRKVELAGLSEDRDDYAYRMEKSVLLDEKLYFVNGNSVMMFDTQTEKLRDIKTPHSGNRRTLCIGLVVVRDLIHFCVGIVNSEGQYETLERWRMDGDGDGEGDWTKVETFTSEEDWYWSYPPHVYQCHLMRNGNWLVYSDETQDLMPNKYWPMHTIWGGCVYMLDANNHTKHIICSIRFPFRPEGRFIETIVSPNQYLK